MSDALIATTAEAIARRALFTLPADAPRGRADIARLPAPVARLLAAQLDAAVDDATPTSAWIDDGDDRVREATESWRSAARAAARVPAEQWDAAVRQAAEQALAHLIRPADTLAAAAFDGDDALDVSDAISRARAFGPYPYLPEIAARYAVRKELGQIDRSSFEQLLLRIDRRMVQPFGASDWITLLGPLFDLVGPVSEPEGSVPSALLRELFHAKGADALADALPSDGTLDAEALSARLAGALGEEDTDSAPKLPAPDTVSMSPDAASEEVASTQDEAASPSSEGAASSLSGEEEREPAPVISSKFHSPEFDAADDSDVLGPARPIVFPPPQADDAPPLVEPTPEDSLPPATILPSDPTPVDPEPEDDPWQEEAPLAENPPMAPAPPTAPDVGDDEPLWVRLARDRDAPPASPRASAAPPPPPSDEDVPLWKRFAQSDLADRLPAPDLDLGGPSTASRAPESTHAPELPPSAAPDSTEPLGPLETRVLGADASDRRSWYITELFSGDPSAYRQTITALDNAATYTDATAIVSSEVLRRHSVSPYTEAAVAFIDAIQAQFESR